MNPNIDNSLAHLIYNQAKDDPTRTVFLEKYDGKYKAYDFNYAIDKTIRIAKSLVKAGLDAGDRIAIMSTNCLKWALIDYGSLSAGLIVVPIYPTLLSKSINYILEDSESKLLFVQNKNLLKKILEIPAETLPSLKKIVLMEEDAVNDKRVVTYKKFMSMSELIEDKIIDERLASIDNETLATIIYTSGTTGIPKGVMLSHENILDNVANSEKCLPFDKEDEILFLSFLPLSHVFERMTGHFLAMKVGGKIAYAECIESVAKNMNEVQPTVMASVPRLYEKMHDRIIENIEQQSNIKKKLFYWAVCIGKDVVNKYISRGVKPHGFLAIKYAIANKLVYSKIKKRVGGKLKFFVSGGGALRADIAEFFAAVGLYILEGYGLTETSPVITVNRIKHFKFGKVGPTIPNVELKIAEDGEILTRGKNVMLGYYKDDIGTKMVIDKDAWFHTGDIGEIDEDGFLKITDRKKDIIVTSGGKNIAPLPIESALLKSKYIEQAVIVGDAQKFCSAIIVVSQEALKSYANEKGIKNPSDCKKLIESPKIIELYKSILKSVNQGLASYETIKKCILKTDLFTIESGELTPKMSIKRRIIQENNKGVIKKLYEN